MGLEFIGSKRKLPVAKHLTDEQYRIFIETQAAHNRSWGLDQRDKYGIHNVTKVTASEDGTFHVYYADGNWWHYTKNKDWY